MNWEPISTAPADDGISFLVRTHAFGGREAVVIQVSRFEGRLYPDALGGCIDWSDSITNAKWWQPLPSPPGAERSRESTERGEANPSPDPGGVVGLHPVFAFLLGTGPLDGSWFGDGRKPEFWWRKYLRAALSPQQGEGEK